MKGGNRMKKAVILLILVLVLSLCIEHEKKPEEAGLTKIFSEKIGWYNGVRNDKVFSYCTESNNTSEISKLLIYNLTTAEQKTLYEELYHKEDSFTGISAIDISVDLVVWDEGFEYFPEKFPEKWRTSHFLYLYNLSSGKKDMIHKSSNSHAPLRIEGDRIIWEECDGKEETIHLYDLKSREEEIIYRLPRGNFGIDEGIREVEIYKEWVLWYEKVKERNEDLTWDCRMLRYDMKTGEIEKLFEKNWYTGWMSISDDTLLYFGERNSIWGYGLDNKSEFLIYESPSLKSGIQVEKYGNILAWTNKGEPVVYYCNLKTKKEARIPPPEGLLFHITLEIPIAVYGNKIVIGYDTLYTYVYTIPENML
jgi:hypothetical protein